MSLSDLSLLFPTSFISALLYRKLWLQLPRCLYTPKKIPIQLFISLHHIIARYEEFCILIPALYTPADALPDRKFTRRCWAHTDPVGLRRMRRICVYGPISPWNATVKGPACLICCLFYRQESCRRVGAGKQES